MGRSFTSVRIGVQSVTGKWEMTAGKLDRADRESARDLSGLARNHSSAAFFGCDNPLEAALLSVLLEVSRNLDGENGNVDP